MKNSIFILVLFIFFCHSQNVGWPSLYFNPQNTNSVPYHASNTAPSNLKWNITIEHHLLDYLVGYNGDYLFHTFIQAEQSELILVYDSNFNRKKIFFIILFNKNYYCLLAHIVDEIVLYCLLRMK